MAPEDPFHAEPRAPESAVLAHRLERVRGTGRLKTAGRCKGRRGELVQPYQPDHRTAGQATRYSDDSHCSRSRARVSRSASYAAALDFTTTSTAASRGRIRRRAISLIRRRSWLRRTAVPPCSATTTPRRG